MRKLKYTIIELESAIKSSLSIREVLGKLNINQKGGNYKIFHKMVKIFNIDTSHLILKKEQKEIRNNVSDFDLIKAISESISYRQSLKKLSLNSDINSNNIWIREKINLLNISIEHFKGKAHSKGKHTAPVNKIPTEQILIEHSSYTATSNLKKRLIKEGLMNNNCSICNINMWLDQSLTLHLDHINGINTDNRIENLRLLCPNCHSLTITYCGKNKNNN